MSRALAAVSGMLASGESAERLRGPEKQAFSAHNVAEQGKRPPSLMFILLTTCRIVSVLARKKTVIFHKPATAENAVAKTDVGEIGRSLVEFTGRVLGEQAG
jgi:hypothetical protein